MAVNVEKGVFVCYTPRCGVAGPFTMILERCGYTREQAASIAASMSMPQAPDFDTLKLPPWCARFDEKEELDPIDSRILGAYRGCPVYMLVDRGFPKKLLQEWDVGWDSELERVVLPVRNRSGKLVGVSKRATREGDSPKYLHHFQKGMVLYGEHRVVALARTAQKPSAPTPTESAPPPTTLPWLVVVESQMSVLRLSQYNVRSVGTNGAKVTDWQKRAIARYPRVILAMDGGGDTDGPAANMAVGKFLLPRLGWRNVRVADRYHPGTKDPDEHVQHGGSLEAFLASAVPFDEWRLRRRLATTRTRR